MTCTSGKVPFRSRKEALKSLNAQRKSIRKYGEQGPHNKGGAKRAYRCPECGRFHLTSRRGRK